ncbi:hypothetical protein ACX27_21515 [Nostoc piscinale CENA21]|uniref:Uncharacterized protein n=1 Tax=Nostoc piscinale CENA21 TaxID=224013 RepID=A0A0M5TIK5_9NOSO|nr:hypothetical protein [Nostoc piscinale]ALF54825.1 hypothetical protein ACX27_21515 [Nostoc piscinale CENA21]
MKSKLVLLGWLSSSALLPILPAMTHPAAAQCVMTDVSVQVAVRGSRQPSRQSNNVDLQNQGRCSGNAITQVGTQVYTGSGRANQQRTSRQRINGGRGNGTGINGPTIKVPVGVQVDVYNPAYDPSFLRNRNYRR